MTLVMVGNPPVMLVSVAIKRGGCLVQDQKSASSDQHMHGYDYQYDGGDFDDKMTMMMTIAKDDADLRNRRAKKT